MIEMGTKVTKRGCTLCCSGPGPHCHIVRLRQHCCYPITICHLASQRVQLYNSNSEYARNRLSCLQRFAHEEFNVEIFSCGTCWNGDVVYGWAMCERRHSSMIDLDVVAAVILSDENGFGMLSHMG